MGIEYIPLQRRLCGFGVPRQTLEPEQQGMPVN